MHPALADQEKNISSVMGKSDNSPDIAIFGAGIAGLWLLHTLKQRGYDVILFERNTIGCGQTIAAQGIIHSGLKFSLAGKVSSLAQSISAMPDRWREHLKTDLQATKLNEKSHQLLIPKGFFGGLTKLVAQKALGNNVHEIKRNDWSADLINSGFSGSLIYMDEPVLNVPSLLRALAEPYRDCIKQADEEILNHITPKLTIFTSAQSNHTIAKTKKQDNGLETQKRPLLQAMMKNAPFPLYGHLVGKTDKPLASITTHKTLKDELVWYFGGGVAERLTDTNPELLFKDCINALSKYLPNLDLQNIEWAALPINRIEGKSNTDGWMPDTPTIHRAENTLYCWPTKMTFAPLLGDMILKEIDFLPSKTITRLDLPNAEYTKAPWDTSKWITLN